MLFKPAIQRALGNNNKQNQWGSAKATKGGTVNQVVGDVINGIPSEDLEKWFNELKGQIHIDNAKLQSSIEKSIEIVLVSKVAKIVVEIYKAHCEINSPYESLVLSLNQIKGKANNITDDIQQIITDLKDTKTAKNEIKSKLNESKEQINAEIKSLSRMCEDILYNVRLAYEQCKDNKIEIEAVKGLISNYIKVAELSNKRLLDAIQALSNDEQQKILPSHLAMDKIAEMFAVIQEIIKKEESGGILCQIVEQYNANIISQYTAIKSDIAILQGTEQQSLNKSIEILQLTKAANEGVKEANNKLDILQQKLTEATGKLEQLSNEYQAVANCQTQIDSAISSDEREKLECEFEKLRKKLNETLHELEIATSSGEMSAILPCRYCDTKAGRKIIGGECVCTVCGHRYHLVDPNISEFSDKQIETDIQEVYNYCTSYKENEMGVAWKKLHIAELEEVSPDVYSGLYRMRLGKYTVSSNGVLIIPNKTWDDKKITEIAFCQPNTNDKEGQERLLQVKTLFLSEGITVTEYDGEKPFTKTKFKGLEKVMKWDGDGYVVDTELSPKEDAV